jgi:hypothetical protein
MNPHLCDLTNSSNFAFEAWQCLARFIIEYLIDLSQAGSTPGCSNQFTALGSLPTDLLLCDSILEMIPLILKMYSIESLLYKTANDFLGCFPVVIHDKFMTEVGGILRYIYLLQSSIEHSAGIEPLLSDIIFYQDIEQRGKILGPLYESMVGEVIVWPGFTSTSTDRELVIRQLINGEDNLLFEIQLHPGNVAVAMSDYSVSQDESEILIATSSGFIVNEVERIHIHQESECGFRELMIWQVRVSYCKSWYDFNIDHPPPPILI